MKTPMKKLGWAFMFLMAVWITLVVSRYLSLNPDVFFPEQRAVYLANLAVLITHIVGSMLALLIGPFQFLPGIRKGKWLKVHRWLGRTYLLGVLFGGLSGLYMARLAYGGVITGLGFASLAVLWLYTGFRAYQHIRNKEIVEHRRWMIRNYALTFAAVMLRTWSPLSAMIGIDFLIAYRAIAWLCWVPNLFVAEWILRRSTWNLKRERLSAGVGRQSTVQTEI